MHACVELLEHSNQKTKNLHKSLLIWTSNTCMHFVLCSSLFFFVLLCSSLFFFVLLCSLFFSYFGDSGVLFLSLGDSGAVFEKRGDSRDGLEARSEEPSVLSCDLAPAKWIFDRHNNIHTERVERR